jgi:ribosome biogenesis GTPase
MVVMQRNIHRLSSTDEDLAPPRRSGHGRTGMALPPDGSYAQLGLDPEQQRALADRDPRLELFRVAVEAQAQFALTKPEELSARVRSARWGELSGRLREAQGADPLARPAVGDFVLARAEGEAAWRIEAVLPRRSRFVRSTARRRLEPQVIAANVDWVGVVTSPNEDFSVRRLERYLATIHASGARPAVIVNKRDLVADVEPWLAEARAAAHDVPVLATSALHEPPQQALLPLLGPGRTLALVGSSGVGKSSLTNALLGEARQRVAEIRAGDDKGRHTTTHRELLPLPPAPDGTPRGFLVDTPGMRALSVWTDVVALDEAFRDIAALAEGCRFRDCRHAEEPGCAVRAAEDLSPGRLASYLRLREEVEAQAARARARGRGRPRKRRS